MPEQSDDGIYQGNAGHGQNSREQEARKMNIQTFDNVWGAISETSEPAENMKLRAELAGRLNSWIKRNGLNQASGADIQF
ncbi:hypothetical protein [Pantoea anthophila]|uniref:hypothetical protein n=1 Tax=Pantoea anthophila TaxID=470931 RepID=UPI0027817BCC|nr:hypothetical protein [Pantoea anthophila]MDQ1214990.1 hypothetical protein [Pantoea anthophila]